MARLIDRPSHAKRVVRLLQEHPVVVLLGARQVGKTTLAHEVARTFADSTFFDAERRGDSALLGEPELALRSQLSAQGCPRRDR